MDNRLKRLLIKTPLSPDQTQEAIREVCAELRAVQARFALESDSDLIEACIYEMEALRARYRYLLKQAKSTGLQAMSVPPFAEGEVSGG